MMTTAAVLLATVAFGPAVAVAPGNEGPPEAETVIADPRAGGWVLHPSASGEHLARIREDGAVSDEALPAQLSEENEPVFTPLANGWGVAINRFYPGGNPERLACQEAQAMGEAAPHCGVQTIAQRSPAGRWTRVQRLAPLHDAQPVLLPAPVLVDGRIEAAWPGSRFDVVSAAPGGRFGPPRRARERLPGHLRGEWLAEYRGRIYVEGQYGPRHGDAEGTHHVRRAIYPDGRLGRPVFFVRGEHEPWGGETLPAAGGAELFVFVDARGLGVLRRAPGATRFRRRLLLRSSGTAPQLTQNARRETLVTVQGSRAGTQGLFAAELGPYGRPDGETTLVQADPGGGEDLRWRAAIAPHGEALIGVIDEDAPGAPVLHASAPGCRGWSSVPGGGPDGALEAFAGARGTFHFVWTTPGRTGEIDTATAHVSCGA